MIDHVNGTEAPADVGVPDTPTLVEQPMPEVAALDPALDGEAHFDKQCTRIFGPDWGKIKETCDTFGFDFAQHVTDAIVWLEAKEAEIDTACDAIEKTMPTQVWLIISRALGTNHSIENGRRGLMQLLETGALRGQVQEIVVDIFGSMSQAMGEFVNLTLTKLCGETLLGWDEATVAKLIIGPFNVVMQQKRDIFDYLGKKNMDLGQALMAAMKDRAEKAVPVTPDLPAGAAAS